jgi:hypothetical protein
MKPTDNNTFVIEVSCTKICLNVSTNSQLSVCMIIPLDSKVQDEHEVFPWLQTLLKENYVEYNFFFKM